MNTFKTILILVLSLDAAAESVFQRVVVRKRNGKGNAVVRVMELKNLLSIDRYESKRVKVVYGDAEKEDAVAIPINTRVASMEQLRAATVYYHYSKALDYFEAQFPNDHVKNLGQIRIRIDTDREFSQLGYFKNSNVDKKYNNAETFVPGEPYYLDQDSDPWGYETWFRPSKKISTAKLPGAGDGKNNPIAIQVRFLRQSVNQITLSRMLQSVMYYLAFPNIPVQVPVTDQLMDGALIIAGTQLVKEGAERADALFLEKWFYFDPALVPEAIYHEAAHVFIADYLAPTHSNPVNEGFSDYYALEIAGREKLFDNIKYSTLRTRKAKNDIKYVSALEMNSTSYEGFVLGLFYDIKKSFGPIIGNKIIYKSREYLSSFNSGVYDNLTEALMRACETECLDSVPDRLKLLDLFTNRGI